MPNLPYRRIYKLLLLLWLALPICATANDTDPPFRGMVVSIHPLYIIAKQITAGVETPIRLLPANIHGHQTHLAPRLLKQLAAANYILWMGSDHEPQFNSAINRVNNQANSVAVLTHLPSPWLKRSLQGKASAVAETHTWLDPHYAIKVATLLAHGRSAQFPQYKARYMANLAQFKQQVQQMVEQKKASVRQPIYYIAYNDVLQSLERSINLHFVGAYTKEDTSVSPQQLLYLEQQLQRNKVRCLVMTSPNNHLRTSTTINRIIVDPSLAKYNHYPTAIGVLMQQMLNCAEPNH